MKDRPDTRRQGALRVFAVEGPGNIIGTYRHWQAGRDDPSITHVAFSAQLFEACRRFGAQAWVVGSHARIERLEDGGFVIEQRGNPLEGKSGLAFHWAQLRAVARLTWDILRFRPHVVFTGTGFHPFLFTPVAWLGASVIPVLHSLFWPRLLAPARTARLINTLNRRFVRRRCAAFLTVSRDLSNQVRHIAGGPCGPIVEFWPLFRRDVFGAIVPPRREGPLRIMFAGRIERNKGVFDLLETELQLRAAGHEVAFDICGSGSALDELRARVEAEGLQERFVLHGWCDQARIRRIFSGAHVVIVPTAADLVEGFNMVVVEGILAGRPVIASDACPAVDYVRGAVLVVPPGDVGAYRDAIVRLATDRDAYEALRTRCAQEGAKFLDPQWSLGAAFELVFAAIAEGRPLPARPLPLSPPG